MKIREAGAAISETNRSVIRQAAIGVVEALHPAMKMIGMHPKESIAAIMDEAADPAAGAAVDASESDAARILRESANIADWYEATLHKYFTCMADDQFGYGQITRPERLALSGAIGAALDSFRSTLQTAAPGLYDRAIWQDCPEDDSADMEESASTSSQDTASRAPAGQPATGAGQAYDLHEVALREAAVAPDGTFDACLVTPGWGSSGYYSESVLKRDGPKIFTPGLQMFFNHATEAEQQARPEGDVLNLGATLAGQATWRDHGWKGPGLYAPARAIETEISRINALAPAIGLSINAYGIGRMGEADGRKGIIIESLTGADSVDFVTRAGRGGQILLRESATKETRTMADDTFTGQLNNAALQSLQESVRLLQEQNAKLFREAQISQGRDLIRACLNQADLPVLARGKLAESLQPTMAADGSLDRSATLAVIESAINAEAIYLAQITGRGNVAGMGGTASATLTKEAAQARLAKAFNRIGLTESAAVAAAEGR